MAKVVNTQMMLIIPMLCYYYDIYIYIINTCCGHNDNMIIPILFYFGFFGGWDERVICNFNRLVVHGEARKLLQGGCKYLGISLQKMDTEATTLGCFVKN